ncbi:MAG TPA: NrsF family protein [Steroidobacteraceae bacterium]
MTDAEIDAEIDAALEGAARIPHEVPAGLLRRIADSIEQSVHPVRPLPPAWVLATGLVAITAAVAVSGAAWAGYQGVHALGPWDRLLIFGILGVVTSVTAVQAVAECIPGSRRWLSPAGLLAIVIIALLTAFGLLFHDYQSDHFLISGLKCLVTGMLHAAPAGLLGWSLLRRGWALNPISAGLIAGVLAGLAGVTMLELHCSNFEAPHLLVWHTVVVPTSGAIGAAIGWVLHDRPWS